jgi:ATP-dependent 26S proteasome regulatory subunit
MAGTIAILYNDKEFTSNNFELAEARAYNKETATELKAIPSLAAAAVKRQQATLYYASAEPGITVGQVEEILEKERLVVSRSAKNFKSSKAWHFDNLSRRAGTFCVYEF